MLLFHAIACVIFIHYTHSMGVYISNTKTEEEKKGRNLFTRSVQDFSKHSILIYILFLFFFIRMELLYRFYLKWL